MANPPFNLSNWGLALLQNDPRWGLGLPPAGNANYAWIEHMMYHLAPNGKIGLVLANGALSTQTSGEGEIRRKIIEADLIEGIVAMSTQLFYSVTIPVTIWFITRGKKQTGKTLFIDARNMGHMVDRKHRDFSESPSCRHLHRLPEGHPRRCKRLLRSCHHKTNRRPGLHPHPRPLRWHRRKRGGRRTFC